MSDRKSRARLARKSTYGTWRCCCHGERGGWADHGDSERVRNRETVDLVDSPGMVDGASSLTGILKLSEMLPTFAFFIQVASNLSLSVSAGTETPPPPQNTTREEQANRTMFKT